MSKFVFVHGSALVQALYEAGVIPEDFESVRRVVIDLEVGAPGRIYLDRFADDAQLVAGLRAGLQVVPDAQAAGPVGANSPVRTPAHLAAKLERLVGDTLDSLTTIQPDVPPCRMDEAVTEVRGLVEGAVSTWLDHNDGED